MFWEITGNISDIVMAIAAIIALVYASKEYHQYIEQKKIEEEQERKHDEQEIAQSCIVCGRANTALPHILRREKSF